MKKIFLLISLVALIATARGETVNLSPEEAVRRSMSFEKGRQAVKAGVKTAEQNYKKSRTALFPVVKGESLFLKTDKKEEYGFDITSAGVSMTISPETESVGKNALTLVQPLFSGFAIINAVKSAKKEFQAADAGADAYDIALVLNVSELYWRLYKLSNTQQVLVKTRELMESHLADVESFFEQGITTRADILRAKNRLSNIELEMLRNGSLIRQSENMLKTLTGIRHEDEVATDADPERMFPQLPSEDECVKRALKRNSTLRKHRLLADAAEYKLKMSAGSFFPEVRFVGTYHYDKPNSSLQPVENKYRSSWEAGISVSLDLFTSGRRIHERAGTGYLAEKARLEYEKAELDLEDSVKNLLLQYKTELRRKEVVQDWLSEAEENFRITGGLYQQGMAVHSDYLDAEATVTKAKIDRINILADINMAYIRIRAIMGEIFYE